jgi:hypothetical protein
MPRYAKSVEGVDQHYQPEDLFQYVGEPFDVRVSILDQPPENGLWATVPAESISHSLGQLLDEAVIGVDAKQTEFIRNNVLELTEFPHLSDALDWVAEEWHRYRQGESSLNLCINFGPDDVPFTDSAREHMGSCVWQDGSYNYMLLDLVFEPNEKTLAGMLGGRKGEFLLWMQGLLALYQLDLEASAEKHLRKKTELAPALEQLRFHNLVAPGARGRLEITQQGRRNIGRLVAEQEELINEYDIYRDVVLRGQDGAFAPEFATLSGADYRVAVYRHHDIDPFRAVFLLSLLSGELDQTLKGKGWLKAITDSRFFEKILAPAMDHAALEPDQLAALVTAGRQYQQRRGAQRQRAQYSGNVLQRAQTMQAFPRQREEPSRFLTAAEKAEGKDEQTPALESGSAAGALPPGPQPTPAPGLADPASGPAAPPPEATKMRSTRSFKRSTVPPLSQPKGPPKKDDDGRL